MNLVSKNSISILYKKHILDSLSLVPIISSIWPKFQNKSSVDIGTGGGFPGFILAIFFPELFLFLVDSIKKKIQFLKDLKVNLILNNCQMLCTRIEILGYHKSHTAGYKLVFFRAVSNLDVLINFSVSLLEKSGKLIALKKIQNISNEIEASLLILKSRKSRIKSVFSINLVEEGKVVILIKKL